MYCRSCGHETNGARFCPECGAEQIVPPVQPDQSAYQQPNQGAYQQQTYNIYSNNAPQKPVSDMSVGDWMIAMLLTMIPLVGFILLIVWAAGSGYEKPSRKNWAIANLIWTAIAVVICIVVIVIVLASASS